MQYHSIQLPRAFVGFFAGALSILLLWGGGALAQEPSANSEGKNLFEKNCAICHMSPDSGAPTLDNLHAHSPESAILALTGGVMRAQGAHLTGAERRAVAEYVTGQTLRERSLDPGVGHCSAPAAKFNASLPRWNGWSPTVENWHYQPAAQAGLSATAIPNLKLKWAFGYPDIAVAWAQPTVMSGRIYVGSQDGDLYVLDARTGCLYWTFSAGAGVRSSVSIGPRAASPGKAAGHNAYFDDMNGVVYAVDADSGHLIWKQQVEDHSQVRMTGSLTLYKGRLYVPVASFEEMTSRDPKYQCCTGRGSIVALDAATGSVLWKTYPIPEDPKPNGQNNAGTPSFAPSGGGIWTAPTIDTKRGLIYAGVGNTYTGDDQPNTDAIIAVDMKTGKIRWARKVTFGDVSSAGCRYIDSCKSRKGPDYDFGATPVLGHLPNGKDIIFAGHKSGIGYGIDPDDGDILWQYHAGQGGTYGGMEWGTSFDGKNVYFPVSDITRETSGGLHAVDPATGARVWYAPPVAPLCGKHTDTCSAAQSAAVTVIPGAVFSGSADGGIRAYSTKDGTILWTFDSNRDFPAVNGITAKGGSIIGPGPVVVGGMLFFNSGYGQNRGRPGNVLLAFGLD